jgi:hypothetical protein
MRWSLPMLRPPAAGATFFLVHMFRYRFTSALKKKFRPQSRLIASFFFRVCSVIRVGRFIVGKEIFIFQKKQLHTEKKSQRKSG